MRVCTRVCARVCTRARLGKPLPFALRYSKYLRSASHKLLIKPAAGILLILQHNNCSCFPRTLLRDVSRVSLSLPYVLRNRHRQNTSYFFCCFLFRLVMSLNLIPFTSDACFAIFGIVFFSNGLQQFCGRFKKTLREMRWFQPPFQCLVFVTSRYYGYCRWLCSLSFQNCGEI